MSGPFRIVSIHQPEHLPWLGFFHKMRRADAFVLLDNVQFAKNYFQNRNRVLGTTGEYEWLTVPVLQQNRLSSTIRDARIADVGGWRRKYLGRFHRNYAKSPYYEMTSDILLSALSLKTKFLIDVNLEIISSIRTHLSVSTPLFMASDLDATGDKTDLLLSICQTLNAERYLSGPTGRTYLNMSTFFEAGINVDFHEFSESFLDQQMNTLPFLSSIHYLAELGVQSVSLLDQDPSA